MRLYSLPQVYSALRSPDKATVERVLNIIRLHCHGPSLSVFDPACGPGLWLKLFAERGMRTAGNDSSPQMCAAARSLLCGYATEIVQGDMTDLYFSSKPFDLAVEPSGVLCELSRELFVKHLLSAAKQLRPAGIYLLTLIFRRVDGLESRMCYDYQVSLSDPALGHISSQYKGIHYDEQRDILRMQRTIRVGDDVEDEISDTYDLQLYTYESLLSLLSNVPVFTMAADPQTLYEGEDAAAADSLIEQVIVLKRQG